MFRSKLAIGNNRMNKRRMKRLAWLAVAIVMLVSFIATIPAEQREVSVVIDLPEVKELR